MSDSMLSQDEVDALFKQATGKSIVHTPSSAPSEKPVAKPYVPPPAAKPAAAAAPPPAPQAAAVAAPPKPASAPQPAAPPPVAGAAPPAPAVKTAMFTPQEIRPKPAATPPPVPASAVSQGNNNAVITQLEEMVSELTIRLARAERQIAEMEANKRPPANMATTKDLARLNAEVENISKKLDATPGYNARKLFTCSECGTPGEISIPVKCNHCGQEGWWGWFPKEEEEE